MARWTHTILAAAFTGALSMSAAVAGQPQALGLLAAAHPVPMRCEVGTCRAVLSSFCLQQDHRLPSAADAYRMVRPDTVWLVGQDAASRRIDLPTTSLQFRPAPEYTTIEVLFPEAAFGVVTLKKLTVHLSENASLVPIGAVKDSALSKAVDADRMMARRFFEGADTRRKAADLADRLINRLPWEFRLEPADRRTVWDQVLAVGAKKHRAATTWMIEVYWNCSKVAEILAPHDAPMPLRLASSLASENE
ncbi:MAG: hypothetical protein VX090_00560 [Pseudomonadota bacterium]|nr:hypothetical protein [Pseudomonadota bacterium]